MVIKRTDGSGGYGMIIGEKATKKQLETLFQKLVPGGILHIDDYGLCPGVKKAVDEFFINEDIWLHRVDVSCRYLIKK